MFGFQKNLHQSNVPQRRMMNKSKSNRRFQGASSIEKQNYKNNRRHHNNGSQNAYQFSKKKAFMNSNQVSQNLNERNQYQTISNPNNIHNNVITFNRENNSQFGTKQPKISANLTQSYAQFQEFELNSQKNPVKNINSLINPTQQKHTARNVVGREKKNTLKGMVMNKNKKLYGKSRKQTHLEQLKQRSKNMSDKFMQPNGASRKQSQYEQKKREFLKNMKGNRKTMSNPQANHFMPSNNLANVKSRGYTRSHTNRSVSKFGPQGRPGTGQQQKMYNHNYSNRNNSKQVQQMHKKMNKHKSVSNLHQMGHRAKFKPGSSRNLQDSGIQGLGMNKSTTWKNKF